MSVILECDETLQEEFTVDNNNSFSRLPTNEKKLKGKRKLSDLRSPRQKFCQRWVLDFPWLKPDKVRESLGYCKVCDKVLVCKKSHLERHQKSYKHQRLEGYESLTQENLEEFEVEVAENELDVDAVLGDATETADTSTPEFLECGKRAIGGGFEFETAIEVDNESKIELKGFTKKQQDIGKKNTQKNYKNLTTQFQKQKNMKLDRYKLLKRIDRDRDELNEYYYARQKLNLPNYSQMLAPRDTFDLFFDSMSALAKTFPPKLAAEAKSRVSQIMADFELRSICEREAQGTITVANEAEVMVASTTHDAISNDVHDSTDVIPHIVYSYQK